MLSLSRLLALLLVTLAVVLFYYPWLVLVLLAACGLLWVGWEWVELAVRLYVTLRLPRVLGVEYIALERLSFRRHGLQVRGLEVGNSPGVWQAPYALRVERFAFSTGGLFGWASLSGLNRYLGGSVVFGFRTRDIETFELEEASLFLEAARDARSGDGARGGSTPARGAKAAGEAGRNGSPLPTLAYQPSAAAASPIAAGNAAPGAAAGSAVAPTAAGGCCSGGAEDAAAVSAAAASGASAAGESGDASPAPVPVNAPWVDTLWSMAQASSAGLGWSRIHISAHLGTSRHISAPVGGAGEAEQAAAGQARAARVCARRAPRVADAVVGRAWPLGRPWSLGRCGVAVRCGGAVWRSGVAVRGVAAPGVGRLAERAVEGPWCPLGSGGGGRGQR